MKQTKFNKFLEKEFDKEDKKIIKIGDVLTQGAWDKIISCVNYAVDNYLEDYKKKNNAK